MPLIAFSSPKGGVGKTTLVAQVAGVLARKGHVVLTLDLDPQNALRLHLGRPMRDESGFMASLGRSPAWRSALRETPSGAGLLAFGMVDQQRALELGATLLDQPDALAGPVRDMLADPDLVLLVDTPPGASAALSAIVPLIDLLVVVLLADAGSGTLFPEIAAGRHLGRGAPAARVAENAAVVLNQVDFESPLSAAVMELAIESLGDRLIGAVCRDERVAEALAEKRLLVDLGQNAGGAAEDLHLLTEAIIRRARLALPGRRRAHAPTLFDWGMR